jgi:hypothetical protein
VALQWRVRVAGQQRSVFLLDANNKFYYVNNDPAPPMSPGEYFSCKRPGTMVRLSQSHWRGTTAHDKTDRHFYAYANLNFQLDLSRWCLPINRPF